MEQPQVRRRLAVGPSSSFDEFATMAAPAFATGRHDRRCAGLRHGAPRPPRSDGVSPWRPLLRPRATTAAGTRHSDRVAGRATVGFVCLRQSFEVIRTPSWDSTPGPVRRPSNGAGGTSPESITPTARESRPRKPKRARAGWRASTPPMTCCETRFGEPSTTLPHLHVVAREVTPLRARQPATLPETPRTARTGRSDRLRLPGHGRSPRASTPRPRSGPATPPRPTAGWS